MEEREQEKRELEIEEGGKKETIEQTWFYVFSFHSF